MKIKLRLKECSSPSPQLRAPIPLEGLARARHPGHKPAWQAKASARLLHGCAPSSVDAPLPSLVERLRSAWSSDACGVYVLASCLAGAGWRVLARPSNILAPILHTLPSLMAKPLCLQAARLASANRQALERLIPKLLQILLHAEPPALLFY